MIFRAFVVRVNLINIPGLSLSNEDIVLSNEPLFYVLQVIRSFQSSLCTVNVCIWIGELNVSVFDVLKNVLRSKSTRNTRRTCEIEFLIKQMNLGWWTEFPMRFEQTDSYLIDLNGSFGSSSHAFFFTSLFRSLSGSCILCTCVFNVFEFINVFSQIEHWNISACFVIKCSFTATILANLKSKTLFHRLLIHWK